MIAAEKERLESIVLPPSEKVNGLLASLGEVPIKTGIRMSDLLRRPEITYELLAPVDPERQPLPEAVIFTVQTEIKYEGYIKKQLADAERFAKLEKRLLPTDIDYKSITGLSTEAAQKLDLLKPYSIGAASRISGVSPADISVLLIYLDLKNRRKTEDILDVLRLSRFCEKLGKKLKGNVLEGAGWTVIKFHNVSVFHFGKGGEIFSIEFAVVGAADRRRKTSFLTEHVVVSEDQGKHRFGYRFRRHFGQLMHGKGSFLKAFGYV